MSNNVLVWNLVLVTCSTCMAMNDHPVLAFFVLLCFFCCGGCK